MTDVLPFRACVFVFLSVLNDFASSSGTDVKPVAPF